MGAIGIVRDILIIIVCIQLVGVWLLGTKIKFHLGLLIIILLLSSVVFVLQRLGFIPSMK